MGSSGSGQKKGKKGKERKKEKKNRERFRKNEFVNRSLRPSGCTRAKGIFEIVATFRNTHLDNNATREFYSSS